MARGDDLRYQWQNSVNGGSTWSDLSGATAAVLNLPAVSATMSGQQFRVAVTGAAGSALSVAAALTVTTQVAPPVITVQPADQTVVAGNNTSFSVTVTGTSPSYRWQTSNDGSTWADVPSGTAATLPVATVAGGAAERFFRVVVSNTAGSVTSRSARLTVTASALAPAITAQPAAASVVAPTPVTFTVVATGTPAPAYQWQVSGNNGSTYADVTGATAASYTLSPTSTADSGKVFRVLVSNSAGQVFSAGAVLSVASAGIVPTFTLQPLSQSVTAPATATFTVAASGSPTPTLQWQVSSDAGATFTNIVGATTSSYTTLATSAGDNSKQFRVVASNSAGSVTSLAATLGVGAGGLLGFPYGVSVDASGTVAVTVFPNVQTGANTFAGYVQLITPAGLVTTLAGSATQGLQNGSGSGVSFNAPTRLAHDGQGNLFVGDANNNVVRKITAAGVTSTYAGTGAQGFADGPAASATFFSPQSVAVDGLGNVIVGDWGFNIIRRISPSGAVTTLAGLANSDGSQDGTGAAARFSAPRGVAADVAGNVYVADTSNGTIRKITPAGVVSTLAGNPAGSGLVDGTGSNAQFAGPAGVAVDVAGNVFVADTGNHAIRKISPSGVVTTLAGNGSFGFVDGSGSAARFHSPQSVAVDNSGNVFVADTSNRVVRKVTPAGAVTTWAQ